MTPGHDFRKYDKFVIERIRVQPDPQSTAVDPQELQALVGYFHDALRKAIDPPYHVVEVASADTLRVRITLVDIVDTKPEMSVVVLLTPYATLPDLAAGAASGRPMGSAPYLGQATIAAQCIDARTNEVVAEYAETRYGRKYDANTSDGAVTAATSAATNYLDAYSTWAYAKQAFDQWAQKFRSRLDQIHSANTRPTPWRIPCRCLHALLNC